MIYEHFHRYLFASRLVGGRDVLDLASGEGFGAALLAGAARSVVGIDIDERTVEHSRLNYAVDNLQFEVGDARDLSRFEPGSFGAVVAFELIEHMAEHDQLLGAIDRVLAADGMLIISSPNKQAYTDERDFQNPYHVHELTLEELLALLKGRFTNVSAWAQRTIGGSLLSPLEQPAPASNELQRFLYRAFGRGLASGRRASLRCTSSRWRRTGSFRRRSADSLLVDAGEELIKTLDVRATSASRARVGQARAAFSRR